MCGSATYLVAIWVMTDRQFDLVFASLRRPAPRPPPLPCNSTQQHSDELPQAAAVGGWLRRNAPSRTSGGASGTLCHAYGGRSRHGAAMDHMLSLDLGLLVVRLRDGQRARALRRAAGAWTQPPTCTLPESSWGAAGARRGRCAQRRAAPDGARSRSPTTQLFRRQEIRGNRYPGRLTFIRFMHLRIWIESTYS